MRPDDLLDRRSFFVTSARLAVLAAAVGACTDSLTGPTLDAPVTLALADYPELAADGGVARVRETGVPIAVVHLAGTYTALSLRCPHAGTTVRWTGSRFECPNHGARFAADGHWTGGQSTRGLSIYSTVYDDVAGTLTIEPRM